MELTKLSSNLEEISKDIETSNSSKIVLYSASSGTILTIVIIVIGILVIIIRKKATKLETRPTIQDAMLY